MILLDVGNSSVKWATEKNGELKSGGRFYYRDEGFSRSASRAWEGLPAPRVLAIASVAGAVMEQEITEWVEKTWNIAPCYIRVEPGGGSDERLPGAGYAGGRSLGRDRGGLPRQ